MRAAFARLVKIGQTSSIEQTQALVRLDQMRRDWREINPSEKLRDRAEQLVDRFALTGADALQLAGAWTWCMGSPRSRPFVCGDKHLLDAARQLGFKTIET
jgi:predicted nucleic acid-binding protein